MMFDDLPLDLESEILSRVRATCLKELQTTCKRWYSLFRDPRFVKKNLGKAATHVIVDDLGGYSVTKMNSLMHSINLYGIKNSFDPSIGVQVKLNVNDPEHYKILWWIQTDNRMSFNGYVLGYENNKSCESYKILNFEILLSSPAYSLGKFEIYEFNSDSWRILDGVSPNCFLHFDGVTLKGNTYWSSSDKEGKFILKFDFTTKRFRRLSLPIENNHDD
ncbi:putative F-box domain-containing protein [Arabidopsis thaliana]